MLALQKAAEILQSKVGRDDPHLFHQKKYVFFDVFWMFFCECLAQGLHLFLVFYSVEKH